MTRNDIIKLAREVADPNTADPVFDDLITLNFGEMERFAALVAAAEREACAKVCEQTYPTVLDGDLPCYETSAECAAAIRARSQQ